jgi:hypothetical protein
MRKIICIAFLYAACNSADKPADKKTTESVTDKKETANASGCSKMIFFKEGAEIDSKSYDGNGKETASQHSKITSVKEEGGMTVATSEAVNSNGDGSSKAVTLNYKCDGNKIYFDLAAMLGDVAKERGGTFEASAVEYPVNISEGESLPDATGVMKVDGKEEVKTPAGSWNCYKISHTIEVEMDMPGMNDKAKKMMEAMMGMMEMKSITWFAPDFGVVKSETYNNGKLQSKNEVVAYKN